MGKWGFWDWVGYAVLGVAAVIEALNTSLKAAPDVTAVLPSFFSGQVIGFLPLAFFSLATVILVLRALNWLPGRREIRSAPQTSARPTSSMKADDVVAAQLRNDLRRFVLSSLNELLTSYLQVTSAICERAVSDSKGEGHTRLVQQLVDGGLKDRLQRQFAKIKVTVEYDTSRLDLPSITGALHEFLTTYIAQRQYPWKIAADFGVPVNKKGEIHLQTKKWRDAQERCRVALSDLRVSPLAGPLTDAAIFDPLNGLDEIHSASMNEQVNVRDYVDATVLKGKLSFPELVRYLAEHFSTNPESINKELRNTLALGKLNGVGYGLDRRTVEYEDVLSPIPRTFWRVADFDVAKILADENAPNELGVKLDVMNNSEPPGYEPKQGEHWAYQGIEFDGRDLRRIWPQH